MSSEREPAALTAEELVQALAGSEPGGGSTYVEEIIRRFEPALRSAWRRGGFEVEYREFVQEVFLRLFEGLPSLQEPRAFPGYFRRVALNVSAGLARRAAAGRQAPPHELSSLADDVFLRVAIRSSLELLPPREREVIEGLYFDELPVADLARRLAVEPGAIRTTKSRALKRLREAFWSRAEAIEKNLGDR